MVSFNVGLYPAFLVMNFYDMLLDVIFPVIAVPTRHTRVGLDSRIEVKFQMVPQMLPLIEHFVTMRMNYKRI